MGAEATLYTVELNDTSNDVTEQVIKKNIIKHTDDGSTQIETPEEGAEFQVYLKSAGSYDSAKDSERDTLVCDENGYAETKEPALWHLCSTWTKRLGRPGDDRRL